MPNWCCCEIEAPKSVLKKYINDEGDFDFNKIFKMPESLNVTDGSDNSRDIMCYLTDRLTVPFDSLPAEKKFLILELMNYPESAWNDCKTNPYWNADEGYDRGKVLVDNYLKYGATTWYDWRWKNWGTKWNACECVLDKEYEKLKDDDIAVVAFDTAWNIPVPIIRKIFEDNPDCEIRFEWDDEGENWETHYLNRFIDGTITFDNKKIDVF